MKSLYAFLEKRGQAVFFGLGLLIVVIYFITVSGGLTEFNKLPSKPVDERVTSDLFNVGISAGVGMVILCAVLTLLLGILHVATNIKGSIKLLGSVVAILILFFIFKSTSSGLADVPEETVKEFKLTENTATLVGGALRTALVLLGLTVLAFIGAEVRNLFK